ncbi:MAG: membrane protein insertase YidC, partial [FCB group bacterium]|nr:membrane protein insertase YidC [FCB group bacterium]
WVSPPREADPVVEVVEQPVADRPKTEQEPTFEPTNPVIPDLNHASFQPESFISVETDLYLAKISNRSGGTFVEYRLKNYSNSYDASGNYIEDIPVALIGEDELNCKPCLAYFDIDDASYQYINQPFSAPFEDGYSVYIKPDDSIDFQYTLDLEDGRRIIKTLNLSGDAYTSEHHFQISGREESYRQNLELVWANGLLPTEKLEREDSQNSAAIIYQSGELDDIKLTKEDPKPREKFDGNTDWVAIKNKYFIIAMLPENRGVYGALSARNILFGERKLTPAYTSAIGYDGNLSRVDVKIYLGPQDYKLLHDKGESLEDAMNWGIKVIRPISKYVILTTLTFLHRPFDLFTINYGIVLILFALLVRLVTGPLTKRSYRSTKKMSAIQPKVKELQAKYKSDPQRMNKEVMALYKKHGVNPVGGCLPMVVQMPLLFALFVVFRNTIEFRGAEFIFWIKDLSQPDVIFNLPFSIPIYGAGVAILPILMGVTMFFQQKSSMATMDKSQKPMMYMMTAFFFLLFNQFPSGLNLYYAVYNILNIIQQRSVKV